MLKILHSELQANVGGIETFLLNLSQCINMEQVRFEMLMRGHNQYLEDKLAALGVRVHHIPQKVGSYTKYIKELLRKNNYDFVHIHKNSAANIVLPKMVKKYSQARLIIHSHNTKPSSGSGLGIFLHKLNKNKLSQIGDYHFACSDVAADWMFNKSDSTKNIHIVKNGISARDYVFNPQIRTKYRENLGLENAFVITNVGAFRKQKNHEFLLELFAKLNIPNKKLMLIGEGKLRQAIEKNSAMLGVQNQVLFLGSRSDVANLLQASDLFIMPSLWEGLSIAAIEAQASGLKTLVSTKFSRECQITPNIEFIALGNPQLWIKEIEKIASAESGKDRKNMVRDIRKAKYDMQLTAEKLEKIYERKNG